MVTYTRSLVLHCTVLKHLLKRSSEWAHHVTGFVYAVLSAYTYRMGANDNIHSGKSTFMVELMVCVSIISVCVHTNIPHKISYVAYTQ